MTPKEDATMADEKAPEPTTGAVVEMPWVLISNQIQLLSTQMNERFNDQRTRFDDRFAHMEQRFDDRFAQINQRFDQVDRHIDQVEHRLDQRIDEVEHRLGQRIDQVESKLGQRIDGIEARLTFRNSTWITIILATLGIILGVLLAPRL